MSLAERKWLRIGTLLALYVAQGIPWGFTATTLPPYLAAHGVKGAALSDAFIATTLPYTFKWVFGPIVDAVRLPVIGKLGRRRPWIIIAQLLMALTIGAMLLVDDLDKDLTFLAQLVLVHTVFNALQDVATDGLAVDLLPPEERGRVNGALLAAKYGGGVIGGAGMANLIEASTLQAALVVQVVILLAIMLLPLLVSERAGAPPPPPRARDIINALADSMGTRAAFSLALIMLVLTFAQGMLAVVATSLLTDLKWSDTEITDLIGGYAPIAGLVGSLLGGVVADRIGHKRAAMVSAFALAAGWLVFAVGEPVWNEDAFVYSFALWEALTLAMMTVSAYASCMNVVTPTAGASQFAAYMALVNFSSTLGYAAPQILPAHWAPRDFYLLGCAIQIGCALMFFAVTPKRDADAPPSRARGYAALSVLAALLVGLTTFVVWRKFG